MSGASGIATLAGDVSGGAATTQVKGILGYSVLSPTQAGQVLVWDGNVWVPTNITNLITPPPTGGVDWQGDPIWTNGTGVDLATPGGDPLTWVS